MTPRRLLVSILVVAALLRLVALGREDLWLDECFTATIARLPTFGAMVDELSKDVTPPVAYVLARAGLVLEPLLGLETALRLPSALAGIASVALLFAWVRSRAGVRAGLVAAALLAVHAAAVAHAREARFYSLEALVATAVLALADRTAARWRLIEATALGLSGAVLVLTHTLGAALVAARGAWLLIEAWRSPRPSRARFAGVLIAIVALAAPLLPFVGLARRHARTLFQDDNVRIAISPRTLEGIVRDFAGSDGATHAREAIVVMSVLALAGAFAAVRRRITTEVLVLSLAVGAPLVVFRFFPPRQLYPRYFEFALPLVLLLAARGTLAVGEVVRAQKGRQAGRLAFAIAVAALVVSQYRPLRDELTAPGLSYRAIVRWLDEERFAPGDRVLVHFHGTPGPGEPAAERFALGSYSPAPIRDALADVFHLATDAPAARTFGVITLRRRHALEGGRTIEGATALTLRIVVLRPTGLEAPRDGAQRLLAVDAKLPEHDEARWQRALERWK